MVRNVAVTTNNTLVLDARHSRCLLFVRMDHSRLAKLMNTQRHSWCVAHKNQYVLEESRFDSRHGQRMFSLSQVPQRHKGPSSLSNLYRGPHPKDKAAATRSCHLVTRTSRPHGHTQHNTTPQYNQSGGKFVAVTVFTELQQIRPGDDFE
jgi:hypothetical protein